MNGANRLGGNSLGDLLVFGRRAGIGAAEVAKAVGAVSLPDAEVQRAQGDVENYLSGPGTEDPFQLHRDLQKVMGDGVGIFRDREGLETAIAGLEALTPRIDNVKAPINRVDYNPGWQLCTEVKNMHTVSLMMAKAALMREESRGGHSRLDFPAYSDYWSGHNIVQHRDDDGNQVLTATPVVTGAGLEELIEARKESEKAA
jgi:succinate dehydrogenase / fumarate reductase flavoprotein subunit